MADTNNLGVTPMSFTAGGAIAVGQPVKMDGTNSRQVVACAAINDTCVGIYEGVGGTAAGGAAQLGDIIAVRQHGIARCLAGTGGATINTNQMVEVTTGRVTNLTGTTAGFLGVALSTAVAGDLFDVMLGHLPNPCGPTA